MTRILVTGATGLIGRAVVGALGSRSGLDVWTTSRSPAAGAREVTADLGSADGAAILAGLRPELVIHLAGTRTGSVDQLMEGNVAATARLLGALPEGTSVVVAGSSAEYAPGHADRIDEEATTRPVSPYGWSKVAQTVVAGGIADDRSLRLTIVRPFNIVAPDLPADTALGNMTERIRHADHGRTVIEVGRLDVVRDYVPSWYVAECIAGLALDAAAGGVFNVCSGVGIELGVVLEALGRRAGVEVETVEAESLADLPAGLVVVGDPGKLEATLATSIRPTADLVAAWALGD